MTKNEIKRLVTDLKASKWSLEEVIDLCSKIEGIEGKKSIKKLFKSINTPPSIVEIAEKVMDGEPLIDEDFDVVKATADIRLLISFFGKDGEVDKFKGIHQNAELVNKFVNANSDLKKIGLAIQQFDLIGFLEANIDDVIEILGEVLGEEVNATSLNMAKTVIGHLAKAKQTGDIEAAKTEMEETVSEPSPTETEIIEDPVLRDLTENLPVSEPEADVESHTEIHTDKINRKIISLSEVTDIAGYTTGMKLSVLRLMEGGASKEEAMASVEAEWAKLA